RRGVGVHMLLRHRSRPPRRVRARAPGHPPSGRRPPRLLLSLARGHGRASLPGLAGGYRGGARAVLPYRGVGSADGLARAAPESRMVRHRRAARRLIRRCFTQDGMLGLTTFFWMAKEAPA